MKKFSNYFISFCFSVSMVFCVSEAGAVFLLINPGASAQGTGEAQVARANDAYASYYNPAGLAFLEGNQVVLQHANWLPNLADDIYFDFIGFSRQIRSGTIGGHVIYLNLGTQEETSSTGMILGQFRSYMTALTLGYATELNSRSSLGFNFKVYHQRLADHAVSNEGAAGGSDEGASTDIGFDFGYLLKFGKSKQHNFGLAIQNIGPPIDFVDAEQADPAPTNMKLGFDFLLHSTENTEISMLFDMNKLLVAAYPAMDWDGNGRINGSDEKAHKDEWYKGIVNAWLDDWYYGGDYDYSIPSNLDSEILRDFWFEQVETLDDTYADGIIGGFEEVSWNHVMHEKLDEYLITDNDWYVNSSSDLSGIGTSNSRVYVPNYSGFCEETYRSFEGLDSNDEPVYAGNAGSMCYNAVGDQYIPGLTNMEVYGDHAWIDMPNDGFGEVDLFDANCDPDSNFDCTEDTAINNSVLFDFDEDGVFEVSGENDIVGEENPTWTRLDVPFDRNSDGDGEYTFSETEYGKLNPYGEKEKGSGDDRSFQKELEEVIYNFGLEYNYNNNFSLRAGFIYDLEGDIKNPTIGAGIKFNNYGFDFGYTSGEAGHPRENTMFFSLSIGMGA